MIAKSNSKAPTHRLYVVKDAGETAKWIEIGVPFANKDAHGFTLLLDALPTDGRIAMREITERDGGQS